MPFARALVLVAFALTLVACSHPKAVPVTLLTINIASGAGDVYRSSDNRARQAAFVAGSGAGIIGMEEVDINADRSFHTDTANDVLEIACSLATPEYTADGIRACRGAGGTYDFGLALRGDDTFELDENGLPTGIPGDGSTDRSHDAVYGVALGARDFAVSDAYDVGLPTSPQQPADDPLYTALAQSGPDSPARAELAARNLALRTEPAVEPRTALVSRIERPNAAPLTVIVTHLEINEFLDISANQLARVLVVARAERAGPPARRVIVMGDFNNATIGHADEFTAAGLRRALIPPDGVGDNLDQIWIDDELLLLDADQLPTMGVTDHAVAARATIQ
jgi:endonuclease/exonuclease/phosphatase family metal-dependent hydrolase